MPLPEAIECCGHFGAVDKFGYCANIQRWVGNMKKLESWSKVNEVMYGFAGSMAGKAFETV